MKKIIMIIPIMTIATSLLMSSSSYAQPYGSSVYNANVPYGDQTSLSIATSGNISIPITPTTDGVLAKSTSIVTVTSTDVKGYKLYIRALNDTNMNNLGSLLPTSSNSSLATLAINTWGYNTDASNNFVGISLADTLIRSTSMPVSTGETTTIDYGLKLDMQKPAGNYIANIIYTAVPQTN